MLQITVFQSGTFLVSLETTGHKYESGTVPSKTERMDTLKNFKIQRAEVSSCPSSPQGWARLKILSAFSR